MNYNNVELNVNSQLTWKYVVTLNECYTEAIMSIVALAYLEVLSYRAAY